VLKQEKSWMAGTRPAMTQGNDAGKSRVKGGQDAPKQESAAKQRAKVAQEQLDL